jgi:leucyl-tRNA synthetase
MAAADDGAGKNFARRDHLLAIETKIQQKWADAKVFDVDAPAAGSDEAKQEKYFCTFPYPYMNGTIHLGHAFTLCKAEFAARYQRTLGKRVLWPFGFHCTGMPIAACADKLKREVAQFGNPPVFPAPQDEKVEAVEAPTVDVGKKKRKGKGKAAKKKSKFKYQWEIMREMDVDESQIADFQDGSHWLDFFPPIAKQDLGRLGLSADFRRSFITTDVNPYYDAFIRWHFNTLHAEGKIKFGKRMSVFAPLENQPCADHDRSKGEGVGPQEYTLIKLELLDFPESLIPVRDSGKKVYLVAATLRPETMYGQTNCFVLPTGKYGAYVINDDEVFVCSARSALNMSYQEVTPEAGKPECVAEVMGSELLGKAVKAPLAQYEKVYLLPLLTIKMNKGTGIVTSVPSDAPDDYAALMDLKNKPDFRAKFGLTDEMVLPFEVVPIIDIPDRGTAAAAKMCVEMKVKSQNDRKKLDIIKEAVYLEGFTKGTMVIGPHAGKAVSDVKPIIRAEMIAAGQAVAYSEPESTVISRSGEECVVALTDQWYLNYGETEWKATVEKHVNEVLETYNPAAKKKFQETVDWLREWGCSRSYGLGTKLPCDPQFVIESLSDSTIYMAYYTIAQFLQADLNGSKTPESGITADDLTDEVFNYIFKPDVQPDVPAGCNISKEVLDAMRNEFSYWYPMDLRVSGKDLIGNHLVMSLYNHAAIWKDQPEMWPRSFFTNGHIMLNAEKMSKSTGNFLTLVQAINKYSADATRAGLAVGGDGLLDANFDGDKFVDAFIKKIYKEEVWINEVYTADNQRTGDYNFLDRMFDNNMNRLIASTRESYDNMQFQGAMTTGFFEFCLARDKYRDHADGADGMHKTLVKKWVDSMLIMISPIVAHWSEYMWETLGNQTFIMEASFPVAGPVDQTVIRQEEYLDSVASNVRSFVSKQKDKLDSCDLFVSTSYPAWQQFLIDAMSTAVDDGKMPAPKNVLGGMRQAGLIASKKDQGKAMGFLAQLKKKVENAKKTGVDPKSVLSADLPFEDEVKFVTEHLDYIMHGVNVQSAVFEYDEASAPVIVKRSPPCPGSPGFHMFASDAATE